MNKEKEGKEVKEKSKKKKEKKEKKDTVKTIENYRLGEILGKGGFGTVFKGYNTDTAEFVAVKRITTKKCSKEQIENIHVEITLLKKLNHPRIVRYIDHIQQRSKLYIVIEFVETGSLQDIVQKYGKMKEKIVCMYTAQVLEGLSYLHSEGVIHRDIKGANILTTKEGDIKLADFGVASTLADVDDNPVGTPYWMAPEIIEMNPPTTASDIWSLGATVIELLTGEPPYFGLDPMPALYRIVQDPHPPLPPGISSECEDFLMQCFQKNPQQRKTADQLLHHHWILQGKRKNSNNENLVVDSKEEEKKKNNKLKKFMEEEEDDFDFGDVGSLTLKIGKINSLNEEAEKLKVKKKEKEKKEKEKKDKKKEKKIEKKKVEKDDMDFDIDDNFDFASKLNKFKEDDDDDGFNFSDDENHNPFGGMVNIRPESMDKYRVKKEIKSTFGRENLKKFQDDDDDIISFGDDFDDDSSNKKVDLEAQLKKIQGAFEETIFEFEVEDPLEEAFDTGDNDEDEYAKPEKEFNYLLDRFQQGKMSEEQFISQCNQIVNLLLQYTRLKCIVKLNVSMPFLEVLSMSQQYDSNNAIVAALKLINQFITDDDIAWFQESKRFKETLCLVGFLPVVMQFCKKTYPFAVREQASNFITSMFNTSNLAIRMFIGCQGIKVLVDLLDFDVDQIESSLSLIYEIIDHIDKVINLAEEQTRTPKNDFCRLFSKSGLMTHLSLIFLLLLRKYINAPSDPKSKKYFEKTIGLLVLFSGMDYVVRAHVSQVESLKRILEALTLLKNSDGEQHKFKLLLATAIRNLASHLTVQSFSKAGAIPVLVKLLAERDNELSQQIIPALFHLTKLNRATQIIAVQEGIIPEFQYLFENDFVLKGMIVDIMCEMVRLNPPSVKKELRKTNCVEFYINILGMSAWRLKALESLSKWLNEDKDKIEYALIKNVEHLVEVFSAAPSIFVSSPLLNILTTSTKLSKALSQSTVFITKVIKQALLQQHPDKKVRSDQLRIVHNLYKWCKNPKIMTTELYSAVAHIRDTESSLLIKQTAEDLINAFDLNLKIIFKQVEKMLSGQMLKAQRFSTTTCLPLHQQSNHHHPQHSFDPMNFELYSLNRLISLSTGHYSNGSDGNTINTSLWEEIPTNSLNALLERRSDSDISETPSSVTTPRSLDTNPNNTFGFTTKRSTTVHNNEDPFSGQSNNILPSPVNTSNIKTTTTNHRTELRPFSLPGGSGSSSYNTPNFMLGNTPSNYTTPSILTTSLSTSTTITNNIITKPITFIQIISGGILNIYQVIISLCSNNVILFYFIGNNLIIKENNNNLLNNSIIKSLTYFNEHDISIINIGMDEFGKYLTCLTNDGDIYIIPICKLFFPNLNNYSSLFSNNLIENYDKKENYFLEQLQQIELIISSNDKKIKKHLKIYNELISLSLHPSILFENIVNATKTNTKRLFQLNIHGKITCCQWWITFSKNLKHKFYLILGTEKGFLIYLNLQTQQEEIIVGGLKFGVKNIKIISDGKTMKYLIISCGRGNYFKQIIEQVDNYQLNTFKNICQFYLDLQNSTNGNQQKKDLVMNNAMNDDNNIFKIHRLDRFCNEFPSFFVNVHKIKEKNTTMISCFDREKHLLSMYDLESISQYTSSSIINNNNATTNNLNNIESRRNSIHSSGVLITDNLYPLFSYQLNDKTALTYPTSNILFSVQRGDNSLLTGRLDKRAFFNQCIDEFRDDSEYQEKLWIISRILSQQQQTLNSSSSLISSLRNKNVLQEFNLPLNEKVMGFLPSYLQKEGTNLESVLFWTQSGIYELKEKNSPLKIFEYLLNNCNKLNIMKETIMIDDFGKTFDLNLFQLYENHADLLYEKGDFDLAFHFYKLSNVDEVKYVQKLINCSSKERKEQVFDYLLNLIENPKNLSITKRKELSMLLFKYCLQKLPKKTMQMNDLLKFKNFLLTNEDYDAQKATELLIHYYYFYCTQFKNNNNTIINIELILQLAHKHRLMKYTLELLVIKGYTSILTDNSIDFLYTNGYCSTVQSVEFGVLLNKFSSNIKIKFMLEYIEYLRILRSDKFSFNSDINNINVNNNENNTLPEHFDNHCKIFNFFVETIPLINEIPILLMVCNRFNPEENTLILRETNHTNHHINNQSFYYPYITLEQHIEIFIISMLSLIQLKNNSKEIITSNSNLTTPTMIRNNMSFDNSNLKHIDFTTNILYTHTQEKLEQCLRTFFYRKEFIIDKCLYFNNKSALTIVYEKEEMWIDAICCKINQINENQLNLQNPEIIMKLIFNLFDKYIINKSDELEEETKFKLIEKLFNFYQSLNLPIFKLEEYCLNNLHFIGDSLYQSLLLNNQNSTQFSQQFYSKITDYYTTLHHHLNPTVKL